ncbi:Uncharacterised protein [Vibrio cholerae]|uniref:Uncharacterized protein n=1 Tax=Vibrio cholerae TaxID=666 RepID=A0A655PCN9_VIBCL|nr:Uncharacterised protein [Vibrio cholerae]CSA10446.1 Uncharacterised protein [Vibrio cholerae]CSB93614.1 Uncharacterised protein [Vibrio cholerae]CSC97015.1 Uncharacterised protein [Vibrio cholerae]CSD33421.1 Uncharacterised protein [Vibrio cholerae]
MHNRVVTTPLSPSRAITIISLAANGLNLSVANTLVIFHPSMDRFIAKSLAQPKQILIWR